MAAAAASVAKRCKSTDGGGITALLDELLVEIFSRVGSVKALFLFAVTSRRWLRLFTDPAFLRELCPGHGEGHRARLLGFISRQPKLLEDSPSTMKMRTAQRTSVSPPTFLPAPGSPLGPTERALTSFVADDDGTFNYAQPLAARRGVVLMWLVPRAFNFKPLLLALWNPTTCERHVLPPLESSSSCESVNGYAIVMAADGDHAGFPTTSPSGRFTFSQVLVIITTQPTSQSSYQRHLHWYSAATGSWSSDPTASLDAWRFSLVGERPAAVHRGAAHWLCNERLWNEREAITRAPREGDDSRLHKLSAELGTGRVSLTKLPVCAGGTPLLHVSRDGKLSVACVYLVHVTVWTQQDEDEGAWIRTQAFQMPSMDVPKLKVFGCWLGEWYEFDRGAVLVLGKEGGVFVLNLEKEVTEKVVDCFSTLYGRRIVPYELDLVEFFMSHLGGLLCKIE